MKGIALSALLLLLFYAGYAQQYSTKNGFVGFYSKTPLEDIQAENNQVYAVMDASKKTLAVAMLVKGFIFKKELMQEHFNENYIESDKYPKSSFSGSFAEDINTAKEGTQTIHISGSITLHGITKPFATTASLEVSDNTINGSSSFVLIPADFNIQIPSLVREKIAKEIQVQVKFSLRQ